MSTPTASYRKMGSEDPMLPQLLVGDLRAEGIYLSALVRFVSTEFA